MTRKIPWRDGFSARPSPKPTRVDSPRSGAAPASARRLKYENKDTDADTKASAFSPAPKPRVSRPSFRRPRSSSPAPEPLQEIFMNAGLGEDDMYRMVEDEFYATAQRFTAHLHAAEYKRLKAEAKSQNAATINNISRPVVGRMTDLVKTKQDRSARRKKQKRLADDGATDSESGGDVYRKSTSLFGLMESPRKKIPRLDHFALPTSSTRASAGFGKGSQPSSQSQSTTVLPAPPFGRGSGRSSRQFARGHSGLGSDNGGDDLDTIPRHQSTFQSTKVPAVTNPGSRVSVSTTRGGYTAEPAEPPAAQRRRDPPRPSAASREAPEQTVSSDDESDGALFGFQKRAQQRSRNEKRGGAKSSNSTAASDRDFIPGFL